MNMSELKFEEWWKEYSNSEESEECFSGVQDLKITALNSEQKKQIFAGIMVLLENVARKVWNTRKPDDAKWISVEDELPKDEDAVYCVFGKHEVILPMIHLASWFNGQFTFNDWDAWTITHWIPLPEPPKEDN
jgi:hypothetical protein